MAGHKHLSTTEHYVHVLGADLEDAAKRLNGERGNHGVTPSAEAGRGPKKARKKPLK
jgi:hypothetical protein